MSDTPFHPSGGPEIPAATPFDPGADPLPPGLEWNVARPESVVLFLDAAADRAWAADAAIAVATGWARAGRRVVLADLHLEEPILHERLGEQNLDGAVDVFLYGASLARTARPVPGHGFYLISSGTYTAEPEAVLRHPRWPRIVAGFGDAHASLLLFVPVGIPGIEALASRVTTAILLAEDGVSVRGRLPAGVRVRAVVSPPWSGGGGVAPEEERAAGAGAAVAARDDTASSGRSGEPGAAEPEVEVIPWSDPYREHADRLIGEYADGIPASTLPPGALPQPRESDLRDPPLPDVVGRHRTLTSSGRRGVSPLLWVLLALAVLFAAGYFLFAARPDLLERLRGKVPVPGTPQRTEPAGQAAVAAAPPAATPPTSTPPAPQPADSAPAGVPLPYAVQAKAFASLAAARQMVRTESRRFTEAPLYISPELVDRVLYYKVLAGILSDTVQASRLRARLVSTGIVEGSDAQGAWSLIQFAPLAFDLGEFSSRAAATARADSLMRLEVPTYPVALAPSGRVERWRLYGGAFRDSASAEGMRRLLSARRIDARLVERVGVEARRDG
ncbi:MAG TPA: hypothetical protein VHG28_04330 [Longimicrobiaceae bacterium]|nr:hypothetical protein [Longimicrobiaceae bacterium]